VLPNYRAKSEETQRGAAVTGNKGAHESPLKCGLPEGHSNRLTDGEHTAMRPSAQSNITAKPVGRWEVQVLPETVAQLRLRHETTRMPELCAPARGLANP
jgi:hypothetical protein